MKQEKPKSVSKIVEEYMLARPLLMAHVAEGIINTSSLARKIKQETGLKKTDEAVMIALYRFLDECKRWVVPKEDAAKILKGTDANVRTNYAVAVVDGKFEGKADALISFGKLSVAIGPSADFEKFKKRAIYHRDGLVMLELKHSKHIEDVPGVLFHILAKFYEKQISIMEIFSAWDATYIIVEKKDLKAMMETFFPE